MRSHLLLIIGSLAWSIVGASAIRERNTTLDTRASKKPSPCQQALIDIATKGVPTIEAGSAPSNWNPPKDWTTGTAKNKRSISGSNPVDHDLEAHDIERRAIIQADMGQIVTGTSVDTLTTQGLGTCFGVAVLLQGEVPQGFVNKILAHLSPATNQQQITQFQYTVMNAMILAEYKPTPLYYISLPEMKSQIDDMVEQKTITETQGSSILEVSNNVQNSIVNAIYEISQVTIGGLNTQIRIPGMGLPPLGELEINANNVIYHEGYPWGPLGGNQP